MIIDRDVILSHCDLNGNQELYRVVNGGKICISEKRLYMCKLSVGPVYFSKHLVVDRQQLKKNSEDVSLNSFYAPFIIYNDFQSQRSSQ